MRILGIDPGVAIVGFGVLDCAGATQKMIQYGAINTPAGMPLAARLALIESDLQQLIEAFHPDEMAIEELFFNTNHTTMVPVAEARGVILLCAKQNGLRVAEYTPLQVKQSVVGYGKAVKKQVMHMVSLILRLESTPKLDDTCDALAIAICHANCSRSAVRNFYNIRQ